MSNNTIKCPYCKNDKFKKDNFTCGKYMMCTSCGFCYGEIVSIMWSWWSIGFKVTYVDKNGKRHKYEDYIK